MSESVKILIEADDKASKKFVDAAKTIEENGKKVERILNGLKEPAERYNEQLKELTRLHKEGAISAEDFAAAEEKLKSKLEGNANAYKEVGGKAKSASEFVGVLASISGSPEIAGFAGKLGEVTDKVGAFSEVSKVGGAGAMAFKLGLVGLVGTIAVGLGKALGDVIFQTAKFNREMDRAKEKVGELASEMASMRDKTFANRMEGIELITDPEQKQKEYEQLLDTLNRDVAAVTGNVQKSQEAVEEWADSWKITGERKAAAEMAQTELENDKERLKQLKAQRDAVRDLSSERARNNAMLAKENEAKESSKAYLQSLRDEVEYLKATREEQIKLDAARNTQSQDRGETESLLRERDAIIKKQESEKELASLREKEAEEAKRNAEEAKKLAQDEVDRVQDAITAETQKNQLREIALSEYGKEGAKVQELINKGIDSETAKRIAADDARLSKMEEIKREEDAKADKLKNTKDAASLSATSSRLLTRGPSDGDIGNKQLDQQKEINKKLEKQTAAFEKWLTRNETSDKSSLEIEII